MTRSDPIRSLPRRHDATLAELSHRALAGEEPQSLMEWAVRMVAAQLEVEHVSLLELDPAGDGLRLRAGVGWQEGVVGAHAPLAGGGYAAFALASDEPVVVADMGAERRFEAPELLLAHGVVSSAAVRLRAPRDGARPFGVLGAHAVTAREFGPYETTFLAGVANLLALALLRRRQALELNDAVLQALIVARYDLDANEIARAREVLDGVLERTRALIGSMLGPDEQSPRGLLPGDLRREQPAPVHQAD